MGFEKECENFVKNQTNFSIVENCTDSYDEIDFVLKLEKYKIAIDCKEKKSNYRGKWSELSGIEIDNLFIFDETSIKKTFYYYPYGFMLVFNRTKNEYVLFNSLDLLCMPKKRMNRSINRNVQTLKGKWIVDFNWGIKFETLGEIFNYLEDFLKNDLDNNLRSLSCYGEYPPEEIPILGGEYTRNAHYWKKDVSEK